MSVSRESTVWCDARDGLNRCGSFYEGVGSAAAVRSEAKRDGWKVARPGGTDLCPFHATHPEETK